MEKGSKAKRERESGGVGSLNGPDRTDLKLYGVWVSIGLCQIRIIFFFHDGPSDAH